MKKLLDYFFIDFLGELLNSLLDSYFNFLDEAPLVAIIFISLFLFYALPFVGLAVVFHFLIVKLL
ncbi:MAG: hypothetical protein HY265_03705 [Deltaproteobacteria bacterium]|nr:hypothetical protein [Deltaproteobacteria bacterium]